MEKYVELFKARCGHENYEKLTALNNLNPHDFVTKYGDYLSPAALD